MTAPLLGSQMCPSYGTCQSTHLTKGTLDIQVAELKGKLERADERILELEASLQIRTVSVGMEKLQDRIKLSQQTETVLQNNIAGLEEENTKLRELMRTWGSDMSAVDEIISKIKIKVIE